jgi:hypothetical protein
MDGPQRQDNATRDVHVVVRAAISAKNRLPLVSQKFNTFSTFNTFAIFNPSLGYPGLRHLQASRVRGVSVRAVSTSNPPLPSETGEGVGGEGRTPYTGFMLIPGNCSSLARWQAAHCLGTISSKAGASVTHLSIA